MNLPQLKKAVALMESYGEGSTQEISGSTVIVRCGRLPGHQSRYQWRFTVDRDGNVRNTLRPRSE